jgi:hypothetical protein
MGLCLDAVRFYAGMAETCELPESFIRDWVAIALRRDHKLCSALEVKRDDFLTYVLGIAHPREHPLGRSDWGNCKVDMVVWEGNTPAAIIEFKLPNQVKDDLRRTADVLSYAREPGMAGYVVTCSCFPSKSYLLTDKVNSIVRLKLGGLATL